MKYNTWYILILIQLSLNFKWFIVLIISIFNAAYRLNLFNYSSQIHTLYPVSCNPFPPTNSPIQMYTCMSYCYLTLWYWNATRWTKLIVYFVNNRQPLSFCFLSAGSNDSIRDVKWSTYLIQDPKTIVLQKLSSLSFHHHHHLNKFSSIWIINMYLCPYCTSYKHHFDVCQAIENDNNSSRYSNKHQSPSFPYS